MVTIRLALVLPLWFAACAPAPDAAPPATPPPAVHPLPSEVREAATTPDPPATPPPPVTAPSRPPTRFATELGGIAFEGVRFSAASHTLRVVDQPDGPGSRWASSREAGRSARALAAINGGFFTPEGEPLGLVIASGKRSGAFNRASSLASGFYLADRAGRPALVRRGSFSTAREALQTGPFLVENGDPVAGLQRDQPAARSFLATDGRGQWLIARSGLTTLAELAEALAGRTLAGVSVRQALNLDGGRSAELWVDSPVQNGPSYTRPLWNKPVRNFLVLVPR